MFRYFFYAMIIAVTPFGSLKVKADLVFSSSGNDLLVNFTSPVSWILDATSSSNPQNAVVWIPGLWSAPQPNYLANPASPFQITVGGVDTAGNNNAGTIDFGDANRHGLFIANSATTTASDGTLVSIPIQTITLTDFLITGSLPDQQPTLIHLLDELPFRILGSTAGDVSAVPEPSSLVTMGLAGLFASARRRRTLIRT